MKAASGELRAGWNKREADIGIAWGGNGATKQDANLLFGVLAMKAPLNNGRTFVQEMEARGYDLTTLRFSIRQKSTENP